MFSSLPAEPERNDPKVSESQPCASLWVLDDEYNGPPEDGQPRAGSKEPSSNHSLTREDTGSQAR
jgi:hypothetical protein